VAPRRQLLEVGPLIEHDPDHGLHRHDAVASRPAGADAFSSHVEAELHHFQFR